MDGLTRRRFLAASTALTGGIAGCTFGNRDATDESSGGAGDGGAGDGGAGDGSSGDRDSGYTAVYQETIPSVVFVGDEDGGGSGFVTGDGVVTNHHVVSELDEVHVRFEEGEWREAAVAASDVYADLAVLSTDVPGYASPLSFVEEIPPVGTEVLALGSPFGLESSVSAGIISGRNRSLPSPTGFAIPNTVQTDAGLDPGNSGGPLVTVDGEVTGIAVAEAGTSVGFAVSPLLARRVLPALAETGSYDHPYLGISLLEVTPTIAEANDLEEPRGVFVLEVLDDGPADQTLQGADGETTVDGRRVPTGGDVLVELDGNEIDSGTDLGTTLALELSPGERVPATVIRDGNRREIEVPIGARPDPGA